MAKTATAKTVVVPAPAAVQHTTIDITPAEGATQALTLRAEALGLVVIDKDSHRNALEFIRSAKQLKRKIEDHWSAITRNVDGLKKNLLDLKRRDLEPVEAAIEVAAATTLRFEQQEADRVRRIEAENRRLAEEKAARDRADQLREQEDAALRLEQDSPNLSPRESVFVDAIIAGFTPTAAAQRSNYKDAEAQGARLIDSVKIRTAIATRQQVQAIRQEAAAVAVQPLDIKVEKVISQTAKVAGVSSRSTWSAEVVNFKALLQSLGITDETNLIAAQLVLQPDTVFLNQEATKLHEKLSQTYPGVEGREKRGIAG